MREDMLHCETGGLTWLIPLLIVIIGIIWSILKADRRNRKWVSTKIVIASVVLAGVALALLSMVNTSCAIQDDPAGAIVREKRMKVDREATLKLMATASTQPGIDAIEHALKLAYERVHPTEKKVSVSIRVVSGANGTFFRTTTRSDLGVRVEQADGLVGAERILIECNPRDSTHFVFRGSDCDRAFERVFGMRD